MNQSVEIVKMLSMKQKIAKPLKGETKNGYEIDGSNGDFTGPRHKI